MSPLFDPEEWREERMKRGGRKEGDKGERERKIRERWREGGKYLHSETGTQSGSSWPLVSTGSAAAVQLVQESGSPQRGQGGSSSCTCGDY